jgi:hypothetical protein
MNGQKLVEQNHDKDCRDAVMLVKHLDIRKYKEKIAECEEYICIRFIQLVAARLSLFAI